MEEILVRISPHHPHPRCGKSLLQGGRTNWNEYILIISIHFYKKVKSLINHLTTYKNIILGDGWSKYWSVLPPPIPIPSVAKVSCKGAEPIETNFLFGWLSMIFHYPPQTSLLNLAKANKIVYWVMEGTNIGPIFLPTIPIPCVATVSCHGAE